MKKNITAIICGIIAAVVAVTGSILSFGRMEEQDSIGATSALTIALSDAGVSREEAKNAKSVFEKENRKYIFDVEFDANGNEYDYDIDASTGEILKRSVERNKTAHSQTVTEAKTETTKEAESKNNNNAEKSGETQKATKENTTAAKTTQTKKKTTQAETSSKYIGLDKSKNIALKNADFSSKSVRFTKAKLDYDDGMAVYEIEFINGNTKYEYEINAKTGKIVGFDREAVKTAKNSVNHTSEYYDDDDDDEYDDD